MLFALMFLSSAFFPRELMTGWFQDVAAANPFSYLIEGVRYQVITAVDVSRWMVALVVAFGFFFVGLALSSLALRARLRETS